MKLFGVFLVASFVSFSASAKFIDEGACKQDRETLCKDAADGRAAHKCMRDNKAKLSPECRAQLENARAEMKKHGGSAMKACRADAVKLCKDLRGDHARIMQCMEDHKAELSPKCRKAIYND